MEDVIVHALLSAHRRIRKPFSLWVDPCELKASLVYRVSSGTARTAKRNPYSKKKKKKKRAVTHAGQDIWSLH